VEGRLHLVKSTGEDIWVQEQSSSVGIDIRGHVDKEKFKHWIDGLFSDPDVDLVRFKGILAVQGQNSPFMFQGMHTHFRGCAHTERIWQPNEQKRCKVLLVGSNLNIDKLVGSFAKCMVEQSQPDTNKAWITDLSGIASRLSNLAVGRSN